MECNGEAIDGIRSVTLRRSDASGMGLGFSIMGGAGYDFPPVIYGIEKDSPAARSGVLEAGDIILAINEREVVKLSTKEVLKCLRLSGEIVHIQYKRDPHVVSRVRKFLSTPASHYLNTSGDLPSPNHTHSSPQSRGTELWQNSSSTIVVPPPVSPRSRIAGSDKPQELQNHISSFSEDVFINHSHNQQTRSAAKSFQSNNPFASSVEKNGRKNFETFVMTGEAILNLTRNDANDSYRSPTKTASKLTPMSPMAHHIAVEAKSAQLNPAVASEIAHHTVSVDEDTPPLPPPPPSNTSSRSEKADTKSDALPPPPLLEGELNEEDSRSLPYCSNDNGVIVYNNGDIKDGEQRRGEENSVNNNEDTSISSSVMSDSEEVLNDDDDDDDQELLIGSGEKDKNKIILKIEAKNNLSSERANCFPNGSSPKTQVHGSAEKERYPEYLLLGKGSPNASEDDCEPNSASESISPTRKHCSRLNKRNSSKETDNESEDEIAQDQELDESSESGPNGKLPNGSGGESDSSDVESMRIAPIVKAVDLPSAERLAKRLYNLDGFRATDVWRQLCKCNDFSRAVANEYLKAFDFRNQTLDVSLRKFLSVCPLRGETSDRERVLEHFSVRYVECNPNVLGSGDSVHTLTCALMLLNTDIYSDVKSRRHMSCSDFIKNLNGLNDGKDFPKEILKQLYHSIKSKPLVSPNDAEDEDDSNREVLPVEPPVVSRSQEYKRGFLKRKSIFEAGGKKTKFSAPALEPPISSSRRFERPLLPSSLTRLNTREQLVSHQTTIAKFEDEYGEWNQLQDSKSTSSFQKKEIRERLIFYQFEIQRYKVYVEELEKRINEEIENPGGQEELVELQVLPNPPAVLVEEADENFSS